MCLIQIFIVKSAYRLDIYIHYRFERTWGYYFGLSTNLAQLLEMEGKLMKAYIVLTQTIFEKQKLNITDKH